jgi:hypothetical protein
MFHDADEIRRSDVKGERMIDAIARVDSEGFNAIDFQAYTFVPPQNVTPWENVVMRSLYFGVEILERHFTHWTLDHPEHKLHHIKLWKNTGEMVDLTSSGGHRTKFPNQKVYPDRFILKHYPIRSREHGLRKILGERKPRYQPGEVERGWHVQYKDVGMDTEFYKGCQLVEWSEDVFVTSGERPQNTASKKD